MVVLTIVTQKNGETIFFDEPIPQVHFMRLISCSLYNSWDTLKKEGTFSILQEDGSYSVAKIPPGHYSLQKIATALQQVLNKYGYDVDTEIHSQYGQLILLNKGKKPLRFDRDLANLLDSDREIKSYATIFKKLNMPATYFIHCDLIDRNFNFFNNKKSDLLSKLDPYGVPYKKIRYSPKNQPFRDCSTSSHVNSITISVRDQDGELFDFKGMPLEFELELN